MILSKNILIKSAIFALSLLFAYSCKDTEGESSIDEFFLNYEIGEVAVTSDIPVGALLYNPGGALKNEDIWTRITEERIEAQGHVGPYVRPVLGQYGLDTDTAGALALQQIIDWGLEARIDYFILPVTREVRTRVYPANIDSTDMAFVDLFRMRNDTLPRIELKGMQFALMVDMYSFASNLNNNTLLERVPPTTITWESEEGGAVVQHDTVIPRLQQLYAYYERISDYFSDPGYYRFNGRPVVLIREPERLYAENSAAVYQGIREAVRQHCGEEIYLIAQQQAWTPPARFHYFFMLGKVDAVTMRNMCNVGGGNWERTYYLPQMTNENFKYNREYIWEHYGIDFVPSVAPSYNYYPLSATSYGEPQVPKDPEQFKKYCSVAKMNLGKQRMVIIDGFNNWETDSGIEPTEEGYGNGYGTLYLELVKQQFKK